MGAVSASIFIKLRKSGLGQVVICTGKEINRKTRPASAGLKIFFPNPPNAILVIPMATNAPTKIIQAGMLLGRLNASKTPVIIAEQSLIVLAVLSR